MIITFLVCKVGINVPFFGCLLSEINLYSVRDKIECHAWTLPHLFSYRNFFGSAKSMFLIARRDILEMMKYER